MRKSIVLAFDVAASPQRVYQVLTSTEGQAAFWTADCDVYPGHARFGFKHESPNDITVDLTTRPDQLVRMRATSGIANAGILTWEYELHAADAGTTVLFREFGFTEDATDLDLGYTAHTWAQIMDRLAGYLATGTPQPYFPR